MPALDLYLPGASPDICGMENFLRILGYALSREDSRVGKIKVRYLTWLSTIVIIGLAALVGLNYRHFTLQQLLIFGISLLVYFFVVYTVQESLLRSRTRGRRALYQRWQYQYALPGSTDPRLDGSLSIGMLWQWRQAQVVQVASQTNLQENAAGKMRDMVKTLQSVFQTREPWVLDIDRYRQNVIYAYPVAADSFAYKYFQTQLTIFEIAQNALDARTLPALQFEGLADLETQLYFDHVILSGFQAQHFSDQAAAYAKAAFQDNFIEFDDNHVWEIVTRGNGTVAFIQVEIPQ